MGRLSARTDGHPFECLRDLSVDALGIEADGTSQVRHRAVVDEPSGRDADGQHRHCPQGRVGQPGGSQGLHHGGTEAAGRGTLLERHDEPLVARRRP